MWPFSSKSEQVKRMEQCDHPEWEDQKYNELLYPNTVSCDDGELFVNRIIVEQQKCAECGYVNASQHREEKVYLEVDRVEEVETDD